jgi:hypothetical protein
VPPTVTITQLPVDQDPSTPGIRWGKGRRSRSGQRSATMSRCAMWRSCSTEWSSATASPTLGISLRSFPPSPRTARTRSRCRWKRSTPAATSGLPLPSSYSCCATPRHRKCSAKAFRMAQYGPKA